MVGEADKPVRIDLAGFKLHVRLKPGPAFTLHFNTPSRRFYLSLIAFLVSQMKRSGRITSVALQEHLDLVALLNETVGESVGSSGREKLLGRVYRKWKTALPDLENAPLFRVLGRAKATEKGFGMPPRFSEAERDLWANLFEYTGSEENVRLRLSVDRIGLGLDDVRISWEQYLDLEAWERFVSGLTQSRPGHPEPAGPGGVRTPGPAPARAWQRTLAWVSHRRRAASGVAALLLLGGAAVTAWKTGDRAPSGVASREMPLRPLFREPSIAALPSEAPSAEVSAKDEMSAEVGPGNEVQSSLRPGTSKAAARSPDKEVTSAGTMALPLPGKPSLAVLPFVNMSGDKDQEYFSDGLTEDLITALAKIPDVFVISRNSTFTYKGTPVKVQKVAQDLGVRYVLEGSVQRAGSRVRITAQLIDALSGYHVWSEQYDRELKDIFALQDKITFEILRALAVKLSATGEGSKIFASGTANMEAYVKTLQGKSLMAQFSKETNSQAHQLAEEAIRLDPQYPSAYYLLGTTNMMDVWLGISKAPRESLAKAIEAAQKAVSLDDSHAAAHALLGFLYVQVGEHEKGLAAGESAIEKAPSSAEAHSFLAQILNFSGKPEEALAHNEKAFRLTPVGRPGPVYLHAAHTYRLLGRYEDSIRVSRELLSRTPNSVPARMQLVLAYQSCGREEEARVTALDVLRHDPKFSARRYANALKYKDPALSAAALEHMRRAGLPE